MTEEEAKALRVQVLTDLIDILDSAVDDVKHDFEGGQAGIGTKTVGIISAKAKRLKYHIAGSKNRGSLEPQQDGGDQ